MGVRKLMQFIGDWCVIDEKGSGVQTTHFNMLRGKTIVVDASIYMYKFKQDGVFAELFYNFVSTMKYYEIKPIFVFDGKPPANKHTTIAERREFRSASGAQLDTVTGNVDNMRRELKTIMENPTRSSLEVRKLKQDIDRLEKQATVLRKSAVTLDAADFTTARKILGVMGIYHVTPEHEADPLCAKFVTSGIAYACMSEDTDMFVYGCTRVIRSVNVFTRKCILYTTDAILKNMGTPYETFRAITFVAGNDYGKTRFGIHDAFKMRDRCGDDTKFVEQVRSILVESGLSYEDMIDEYAIPSFERDLTGYAKARHSLRYDRCCVKEVMRDHGFIYVS